MAVLSRVENSLGQLYFRTLFWKNMKKRKKKKKKKGKQRQTQDAMHLHLHLHVHASARCCTLKIVAYCRTNESRVCHHRMHTTATRFRNMRRPNLGPQIDTHDCRGKYG